MTQVSETVAATLDPIIARYGGDPGNLLQILRDAQDALDWLSPETQGAVARRLDIAVTRVAAVVQFYAHLYDTPRGKYRVLFSHNITDRMAGSPALMAHMLKRLKLKRGIVSDDGLVSVGKTSCTGMCDQGPAILVNNRAITKLTLRRIDEICDLIRARAPLANWPAHYFRVEDNIERADMLLGSAYAPGEALRAAIACGPTGMMAEMRKSNLRGRGGAGFPTAMKWEACRDAKGQDPVTSDTSSATPTRANRALSRTACCCKVSPSACSKAWPSPAMSTGRAQGLHLSARRISHTCVRRWKRRLAGDAARSAAGHVASAALPASISTSRSTWAPAPISAARKPR